MSSTAETWTRTLLLFVIKLTVTCNISLSDSFYTLSIRVKRITNKLKELSVKDMSNKTRNSDVLSKSKTTESIWAKAFTSNSEWPDKEEFLDVIYWMRQAIGIVLGLCWGLLPLKGFVGLLLFVVLNAGVIYIYVSNYQNIDEEEYGGMWEITKEGFMTSFAGFLVTWIIMYTGLHGNDSL